MTITIKSNSVIAFDLDDTLYKEVNFVRSAFTEIAKAIQPQSWELLYLNMFQQFREEKDVFDFLEKNHSIGKDEIIHQYRQHIPYIAIPKRPKEIFLDIKRRGGKAGVITDGRVLTQKNKLKALGLHDIADFTIISERTGYDKKDPYNFDLLSKKYPEHEFTYIADNPQKDFIHPNKLGWLTIGILDNGAHIHLQTVPQKKLDYLPKFWVSDLHEIKIS